jgi:hypothetical protein
MSRLERFTKAAEAVLLTAAVASMELLKKYVEEQFKPDSPGKIVLTVMLLLFVLILLVQVIQTLVEFILEKSAWLRSIVLGKNSIEGTWKNVVRTPDREGIWTGGILDISIVEGKYTVRGETFDEAGRRRGIFSSILADFEEKECKLIYMFTKIDNTARAFACDGYSEYQFNTSNTARKIFDGIYIKRGDYVEFKLRGERLGRGERKKSRTEEGRRAIVVDYIEHERSFQTKGQK